MAKRRGRPAFKPTAAHRKRVEQLVATSMSEDDIAAAIGCATETLRKHFEDNLQNGRARRRAEVVELLFKNARKGSQAAQKRLLEEIDANGISRARPPAPPVKEPKLGKNDAADLAAKSPDTSNTMGELMAKRTAEPAASSPGKDKVH